MLQALGGFLSQNAGSIIGAGGALGGTMLTNSAQTAASKKQMEFQRYMSNTAYRRAAKDLEKAGLNRILALGSPASTPQGAQPNLKDLGSSFSSGIGAGASSALASRQAQQVGLQNFFDRKGKDFYNSLPKTGKDIVNVAVLAEKTGVNPNLLIATKAPQTSLWKTISDPNNWGAAGRAWKNIGGWKGLAEKMGTHKGGPKGELLPPPWKRKKTDPWGRELRKYGNVSIWSK